MHPSLCPAETGSSRGLTSSAEIKVSFGPMGGDIATLMVKYWWNYDDLLRDSFFWPRVVRC